MLLSNQVPGRECLPQIPSWQKEHSVQGSQSKGGRRSPHAARRFYFVRLLSSPEVTGWGGMPHLASPQGQPRFPPDLLPMPGSFTRTAQIGVMFPGLPPFCTMRPHWTPKTPPAAPRAHKEKRCVRFLVSYRSSSSSSYDRSNIGNARSRWSHKSPTSPPDVHQPYIALRHLQPWTLYDSMSSDLNRHHPFRELHDLTELHTHSGKELWAQSPRGHHPLHGRKWFRTYNLPPRGQEQNPDSQLASKAGQIAKMLLRISNWGTQNFDIKNALKPTKPLPFKFLIANMLDY